MPFIGLTGGIGTGKTTVLKLLDNYGAHTINADALVHSLLKNPSVIRHLSERLGSDILRKRKGTVAVNRKRLAEIIFGNQKKRKSAEGIIHPYILGTATKLRRKILVKNPEAIIVFEIPLLFEGGYGHLFDKIIVVHCRREIALARLLSRGIDRKEALKRMKAQLPLAEKKRRADFLINNNTTLKDLRAQVRALLEELLRTYRKNPASGHKTSWQYRSN